MSLLGSVPNDSARSGWLTASFLRRAVTLVGVVGFLLATVVQFASHGARGWERRMLETALLWLVGVQGLLIGRGHLFLARPGRRLDRLAEGNPFQFEVGLASISYGTLGVLAAGRGHEWWLATIVAFSIFYFGAAAGHGREIPFKGNRSPGNAGAVLVLDIAVPILLIVLYALYRAN